MTGRGIDQILPHPVDPAIHERWARSAHDYVALAARRNGPAPTDADDSYIWGDAIETWRRIGPDARIVNLETAVTTCDDWLPKGINYRMHPDNIACLVSAGIDCCVLANNHVLDWGRKGLLETLAVLGEAVPVAGAGTDAMKAAAPATLATPAGRILVFAAGTASSGIPRDWLAGPSKPGVNLLPDLSEDTAQKIREQISGVRKPGDLVVFSVHWGGNWGYDVPPEHRHFAHKLIDNAGVDIIHGHSSHHPMGIEIYRDRPILYGCGDFINDYEGISGYEEYRGDLTLMYFPTFDDSRKLISLIMTPMQIYRMSLRHASSRDAAWLTQRLAEESRKLGADVDRDPHSNIMTVRRS